MKFSVLISSYNKGAYLEKCLQSCISQTNKDFEIVVVDNYSSDQTENILKKYSKYIIFKKKSKISNHPAINQFNGTLLTIKVNLYLREFTYTRLRQETLLIQRK